MSKMKILIGYDGSSFGDEVISNLKRAGLPRHAEVLVLSAADIFLPAGLDKRVPMSLQAVIDRSIDAARSHIEAVAKTASQASQKLETMFPGWNVRSESCADSPAWALLKKADQWKPDLIVVGAHGHSELGRFLGSVSQMVLTQASCAVRVERAAKRDRRRKLRIIIGIDGSHDSKAAVRAVLNRAWPADTQFILLSVIDAKKLMLIGRRTPVDIRWLLERADDETEVVRRMLESLAKDFRKKYQNVTCRIREGDPKPILIKEAEIWQADCIFMGARGLTPLKRFFMGGVSTAVAARAHCSVEVVRPKSKKVPTRGRYA
jgi:nucleotide-binding universal stress UspA family protein